VNAIVRGFVHGAHGHSIEILGSQYGFEGLLDPNGLRPLAVADVHGILPKGGCLIGCSTRFNPFFTARGHGSATADAGPAIVDRLKSLGIDALVLIGGDGTTLASERFTALGMDCISISKTIDNDLGETDVSCGFDSAVETATHAVDALHSTAEAHARVMLLEVMGRNAGFIALHAGVAGGADVILIPEVPYRLERVLEKLRAREALGLRFSIVVVAEGARPFSSSVLEVEAGRPGHLPRLGGAGARLLQELESSDLDHEVRLTVLGHVQRGDSPTAFDRILGTQLGSFAAELCRDRNYGRRVVVQRGRITSIPLEREVVPHKRVDADGSLMRAARSVGIEFGEAAD
jgi:6-phosphofructokinase 1